MERATKVFLIIAGLINFAPVIGVVSAEVLAGFYGIPAPEGDVLLLMRHRALLFGILGLLIMASVVKRHLRPAAIAAGLVSMLGFIGLAIVAGEYGAKLQKAILLDVIASIGLVIVVVLRRRKARAA